jgi:hypothetical protein
MRLLRYCNTGNISLTRFDKSETIPSYAILSHTWGTDAEEVTFEDLITGTGKDKLGYKKIRFCAEQAKRDGLQYFWVDTCCIDKTNAAELSTAINSMFRWYRNATRCYVYLSDISSPFTFPEFHMQHPEQDGGKSDSTLQHLELDIRKSKWFTRGWTLQELLAPSSVEFFSQEWKRLGDRISLKRLISEITAIPDEALQGAPLFQFTDNERYFWMQHRRTKVEEDKAYALLGIFGVNIPLDYGEGRKNAFERLEKEIAKVKKCIQDLRCTDPYGDKKRIEETKGGLLDDSYRWILFNADFQRWRSDELSRLFWIKGDPGKGKTMLLCGIINELHNSVANTAVVSYFFCQATDSRINSATAVLRGLLYMLVNQQPSLISHVQKRHDYAGKAVFEDTNAWVPLSEIVKDILQDPSLNIAYLIIDALDECVVGLPMLLELIKSTSSLSTRVKWLLSSRNENHIEQRLRSINTEARLSLELKENAELVARAVNIYIDHKLSYIESVKDDKLRDQIRDILRKKANGTFLWVALVVQELNKPESLDPLEVVQEAPEGLDELYDRMVEQIQQLTKRNSEICRLLLSTVSVAYRPLYLAEIGSLCGLSQQISTYVAMCGSFLTIREHRVYLIHQSAKEYLSDKMRIEVFYSQGKIHHKIFSQALKLMSSTLKRDMHGLAALKFPTNKDTVTDYDPLAALRYSCIHWIDHLCDVFSSEHTKFDEDLQDGSIVHIFLKERYLYWLEALSRFESMPEGVKSMGRLEALLLVIVELLLYPVFMLTIPRGDYMLLP